jgi:hypothetical protein
MFRGTEKYNEELLKIPHYRNHKHMIPFIGKYWGKFKKLLVIGESHYLSPDADEKILSDWYNLSTNDLEEEDIDYTNTSSLVDNTWYVDKGHTIFQNIDYAIIDSGFKPKYEEYDNSFSYISYMNFFQRPAQKTGDSINVTNTDIKIANETLNDVFSCIKPDYLFIVSSKSWDHLDKTLFKYLINQNILGYSCHPTSAHWNKPSMKYSLDKKTPLTGKQKFIKYIQSNHIFG